MSDIKYKMLVIILIFILTICFLYIFKEYIQNSVLGISSDYKYKEPINLETGEINNEFFDIYSDGSNERKTTNGINNAIKYAYKNNFKYIKLKNGNYTIIANEGAIQYKGIILYSNIILDLNGSSLVVKENSNTNYSVFSIFNVENVCICNGKIIGDRYYHIYNNNSHEWGMGITIRSSKNIKINNLEICEMTGDGICVSKLVDNINSNNVEISDCNIHNCRRQGITISSVENLIIKNNEIHDINGTNPQTGIDLESDLIEQKIDNVEVYNNKIYNLTGICAIQVARNIYSLNIFNNEIQNSIHVYDARIGVNIKNNFINNGDIILIPGGKVSSQGGKFERAIVENNKIYNGKISATLVSNLKINNNEIINGNVQIVSSNTIMINNIVRANTVELTYAYSIETEKIKNKFIVYMNNNNNYGNISNNEYIEDSEYIEIIDDMSKINID